MKVVVAAEWGHVGGSRHSSSSRDGEGRGHDDAVQRGVRGRSGALVDGQSGRSFTLSG